MLGAYEPHGRGPLADAVERAAPEPGDVRRLGPLTVAPAPGDAIGQHADVVVVLDGDVLDPDPVARGLPSSPEASIASALAARMRHADPGSELRRLRGAFALLAADRRTGEAVLARDQLGAAGLYVLRAGRGLAFGSELRDVLSLASATPAPDDDAVVCFLAGGTAPGDRTVFSGVTRVAPGGMLRLSPGAEPRAQRWWQLRYRLPEPVSFDEAALDLRQQLERAVGRAAPPGSRTGVLLSGGLDSTAVATVAVGRGDAPVTAYSAAFGHADEADESPIVARTAQALGLRLVTEAVADTSLLAGADRYAVEWREPCPVPNLAVWLPLMRRAAQDGTDVLLDGEGGDELFGLASQLVVDELAAGRLLRAWRLARSRPGPRARSRAGTARETLALAWEGLRPAWLASRATAHARQTAELASLFRPEWRQEAAHAYAGDRRPVGEGPRWWCEQAHVLTTLREELGMLAYFRRRARMAGVVQRHPLLADVDLVEWSLRQPPELTYHPVYTRPVLRAALAGRMPVEVRLRTDKTAFTGVAARALEGPDRATLERLLSSGSPVARYLDPQSGLRRLLGHGARRASAAWIVVWRTAAVASWLDAESR